MSDTHTDKQWSTKKEEKTEEVCLLHTTYPWKRRSRIWISGLTCLLSAELLVKAWMWRGARSGRLFVMTHVEWTFRLVTNTSFSASTKGAPFPQNVAKEEGEIRSSHSRQPKTVKAALCPRFAGPLYSLWVEALEGKLLLTLKQELRIS